MALSGYLAGEWSGAIGAIVLWSIAVLAFTVLHRRRHRRMASFTAPRRPADDESR